MVSVEYHSAINIGLNCCLLILIWQTFSSNIFSFNNYQVGLSIITHKIFYEDFPAEVDITFGRFEKYACLKSQNSEVLTLCSNILSLESSGIVYKVGCFTVFCSIFFSIANLALILLGKNTYITRIQNSHYITAALYWIFIFTYFILSDAENMVSPRDEAVIVNFEKGAFYMFLAGGVALCILGHYIFMRRFLDFDSLLDKCQEVFAIFNDKNLSEQEDLEKIRKDNIALNEELRMKEREIGDLNQKVTEFQGKIEVMGEVESNSSHGSMKMVKKKKVALRSGKGKKVDTVDSLKQEIGDLRAQYAEEKHQWDEEKKHILEQDPTASYLVSVSGKIEQLQEKLLENPEGFQEGNEFILQLDDIRTQVECMKRETVDKEKEQWENEKTALGQAMGSLQEELENAKAQLVQLEDLEVLRGQNERLSEELGRSECAKKNLTEKVNEMGEEVARLEKELFSAQEYKHNLESAGEEIAHLKASLVGKQDDIEKYLKTMKSLKEEVSDKENRIEEFEQMVNSANAQIRSLDEQVDEYKKAINEKENLLKQEREESRKKIEDKDEELSLVKNQALAVEKELAYAKKTVHAEKTQECNDLKLEMEVLENKVISLNGLVKKHREMNSSLEVQLHTSEMKNDELQDKLNIAQDTVSSQRIAITELKGKVNNYEELSKDYQKALETIEDLNAQIEDLKNEIQALKEKIRSLEAMKKDKEFYEKQYHSALQDLENSNKQKRDVELELVLMSNMKTENQAMSDQVAKLSQALDETKSQLNGYRNKFSEQEMDFDKERDELLYTISKNKKEIAQLERKLKNQEDYLDNELDGSLREQEKLKDDVKNLTAQNEIYKQEAARLNHLQQALKQQLNAKDLEISELSHGRELHINHEQAKKIYENQIEEIQKNLKDTEERMKNIMQEKESLREELAAKQSELQSVSEELIGLQNQVFSDRKKSSVSPEMGEHLNYSPLSEHQSLELSARSAQDLIIIESITPIYNNPLLENVSRLRKEPPMTYKNVWKLFEAMMLDKCKMDRLELAMSRQPRTMTEYMLDFVYLHYGLKALALKQLKALIASLEQLYKQGHPYGVLFCRFLGLFHPRPLSYQISIYLLMIQEQFVNLSNKVKDRPSNFSQTYEIAQYGGQASIIDVMDLVQKICRNNREIGERIITAMHKDRIDKVELSILKICGCMARMGKTSDFIFEILNAERRGRGLEYQDFIDGIRYTLNIWVTQEEAEDLCEYIDQDQTGLITFDSWYQKVNFVEFAEKMYSRVAMITKSDFLNALVDEYEREIVDDYRVLKNLIKYPVLNQAAMSSVLLTLDPNLEDEDIDRIYDESRMEDPNTPGGVTPHAVCVTVLKHNIGGYGIGMFDVYALDGSLPKTSTEGVRTELVVERDTSGRLEIDLRKRNK